MLHLSRFFWTSTQLPLFATQAGQFMTRPGKFLTNREYDFDKNPIYSVTYESLTCHNQCSSKSSVEIFRIYILLFLPIRVEVEPGWAEAYPAR